MREWLRANPDRCKEIEEKIRAAYRTVKEGEEEPAE